MINLGTGTIMPTFQKPQKIVGYSQGFLMSPTYQSVP